jgi:hypothetical protein
MMMMMRRNKTRMETIQRFVCWFCSSLLSSFSLVQVVLLPKPKRARFAPPELIDLTSDTSDSTSPSSSSSSSSASVTVTSCPKCHTRLDPSEIVHSSASSSAFTVLTNSRVIEVKCPVCFLISLSLFSYFLFSHSMIFPFFLLVFGQICLHPPRSLTSTVCGHIFCLHCISTYLNSTGGKTCPVCRKPLTSRQIFRVYLA